MTMNEAAARRRYGEVHKDRPWHDGTFTSWSKEPTRATPFHFEDGVEIYVADADVNPSDDFLSAPDLFANPDSSDS